MIDTVVVRASCSSSEAALQANFLQALQNVIDNGGTVISVVRDDIRFKKAYVIKGA